MTMKRFSRKSFLSLSILLVASALIAATWSRLHHQTAVQQTSHEATVHAAAEARLNELYGQLPLSFEPNLGQAGWEGDLLLRWSTAAWCRHNHSVRGYRWQ